MLTALETLLEIMKRLIVGWVFFVIDCVLFNFSNKIQILTISVLHANLFLSAFLLKLPILTQISTCSILSLIRLSNTCQCNSVIVFPHFWLLSIPVPRASAEGVPERASL